MAIPIKVALRCRPLIEKEQEEGCQTCLTFVPCEPQVILGADRAFTYDYVFTPDTAQRDVYEKSVEPLVKNIFKGYNATVLAYGQTGSGKTFSMGGGDGVCSVSDDGVMGVIPRVIARLFDGFRNQSDFIFRARVSYLEIYMEDLLDLLVPLGKRDKDAVTIREDNAGIKIQGLTEKEVSSAEEMMKCLEEGSHGRTTGSTAMNSASSRSHAIFTIYVERTNKADSNDYWCAKFNLVDLAGSERQKKTHAQGERFKEGVNINKGLLALGNVISALGDEVQRAKHVPYRDSKLTRLLQDSLGGNSYTVMLACVSPADSNMEETLSTLRYADRARQIKNKPVVNRDPQAAEILRLRQLVQELQSQMFQSGKTVKMSKPQTSLSSSNSFDVEALQRTNEQLKELVVQLERDLQQSYNQNEVLCAKVIVLETQKENLHDKIAVLKQHLQDIDISTPEGADAAEKHMSLIKSMQEQVADIEKTQNEDIERFLNSMSESDGNDSQSEGTGELDAELNKKHLERKAQLNKDLVELNRRLDCKEQQFKQLGENTDMLTHMKQEYEENISTLNSQIKKLTNEKVDLEGQLLRKTVDPNKEDKKIRIKELESELSRKNKQVQDAQKMLKIKEQSTKDMDKLKVEIHSMKQQRVKLMRQIKEDNDNFRKWKQQKDKEVTQLKAQDRKRQVEITRLEQENKTQQNILKRKNEEAAALSKRLKEATMKQRQAAEDRLKKEQNQDLTQKSAKIKKMMSDELVLLVDLEKARITKDELIKDRKLLTERLKTLRDENLEAGPSTKRKMLNDSSPIDTDCNKQERLQEIHDIERDVELKTVSIHDLQEHIMELTGGNDALKRSKFDEIKTLVDARVALKHILNLARDAQVTVSTKSSDFDDMKAKLEEMTATLNATKAKLSQHEKMAEETKSCLQKDHQKQTAYFLKQLKDRGSICPTDPHLVAVKVQGLEQRLKEKEEELEAVKKDYTVLAYGNTGRKRRTGVFFSPSITKTQIIKAEHKENIPEIGETDEDSMEDDEEIQEEEEDEWQPGYTPGNISDKTRPRVSSRGRQTFTSRTSVCGCAGGCKTKRCRCVKDKVRCSSGCECNGCDNQEPSSTQSSQSFFNQEPSSTQSSSNMMNTTFIKDSSSANSSLDDFLVPPPPKGLTGIKRKLLGKPTTNFDK